jgi:MFS transporter, CP family, cyanate transporter
VTRQRFVDDEVPGSSSAGRSDDDDVIEVAGVEPPAAVHVRTDDASPRG